jgi:glycosyltransferase involved in cell wall biosynthesis
MLGLAPLNQINANREGVAMPSGGDDRSRMPDENIHAASISVIIATNRSSQFLTEALRSVAEQTLPPTEVVIVDDGSEDAAFIARAANGLAGARVIRQDASGVAIARNVGVAQSFGTFIVFLDDDDRWHPARLETQLQALLANPDAVLGYCGMQSIDESGRVVANADQVAVAGIQDIARRKTGIILPNVMVRRSAFEAAGGFEPSLRLAEDLDLVLSLAEYGHFAFSPEVLVDYRTHANNATKRHRELSVAIDAVVRSHLRRAASRHDGPLVAAHRESLRANQRFAWWSALRQARTDLHQRRPGTAISEVWWATRFAPLGAADALVRRIRGSR